MNKKVFDYVKNEFSLIIGESFDCLDERNFNIDIDGKTFRVHPGIDVTNNNKISFISIRFATEDKSELIEALDKIKKYFDLVRVPNLNMNSEFYSASIYLLDNDLSTGEELKLILWDRVSSIISRYEIELKIEVNN